MDDKLTPADPSDLAQSISFSLRFNGRKRFHQGDEFMADMGSSQNLPERAR